MPGLRGLLVDVGGTLVNDATWLAPDGYRELRLRRMAEALGGQRPGVAELVDHPFEGGRPPPRRGLPLGTCSPTLGRNAAASRRDWKELGFGDLFEVHVT